MKEVRDDGAARDEELRHAEREHGESKYSFMRLINLMYDLITCLTTTPLRLLSVFGSIIAVAGFVYLHPFDPILKFASVIALGVVSSAASLVFFYAALKAPA